MATGGKCNSIIIENDGEFKEVEYTPMKFEDLTKDVILERIKAAGVVGMGGAGFQLMLSSLQRILSHRLHYR